MDLRSTILGVALIITGTGVIASETAFNHAPTAIVSTGIKSSALTFKPGVPPWRGMTLVEGCIGFVGGMSSNPVLQLTTCSSTLSNPGWLQHQKWTWVGIDKNSAGEWDTFAFRNTISDTCISVENNSVESGAVLVHQACDYQNPSQLWMVTSTPMAWTKNTDLVNVRSGKCALPAELVETTELQLRDCGGGSHHFESILERV